MKYLNKNFPNSPLNKKLRDLTNNVLYLTFKDLSREEVKNNEIKKDFQTRRN